MGRTCHVTLYPLMGAGSNCRSNCKLASERSRSTRAPADFTCLNLHCNRNTAHPIGCRNHIANRHDPGAMP